MSLKNAVFAIKEAILHNQEGLSEETFIKELETENKLSSGRLVFYYNNLLMFQIKESAAASDDSKKVNRKWTKNEVEFMQQYIKERQDEGALNITEILEEVAQLLNRGYQSVNYKYYSVIKVKGKKPKAEPKPEKETYQFVSISEDKLPVLATEVISHPPTGGGDKVESPILTREDQDLPEANKSDDLLDILSGLISNVQQLPGINLNELLKSIYTLTNMALQNQDAVQQLETVKTKNNVEKQTLREQVHRQERLLEAEKERNDELQAEVAKLAKEISAFSKLEDAAKIKNLKSYNQRLNYLIDSSGVVLQVGS